MKLRLNMKNLNEISQNRLKLSKILVYYHHNEVITAYENQQKSKEIG